MLRKKKLPCSQLKRGPASRLRAIRSGRFELLVLSHPHCALSCLSPSTRTTALLETSRNGRPILLLAYTAASSPRQSPATAQRTLTASAPCQIPFAPIAPPSPSTQLLPSHSPALDLHIVQAFCDVADRHSLLNPHANTLINLPLLATTTPSGRTPDALYQLHSPRHHNNHARLTHTLLCRNNPHAHSSSRILLPVASPDTTRHYQQNISCALTTA
jgi:hypothetical protein